MNKKHLKISLIAIIGTTLFNCSKEEIDTPNNINTTTQSTELTDSELAATIKSDFIFNEISDIGNSMNDEATTNSSNRSLVETCGNTLKLEEGQELLDYEYKSSLTFDFGAEGCERPDGVVYKGKIKVLYTLFTGKSAVVYENFSFNDNVVTGYTTSVKTTVTENGNSVLVNDGAQNITLNIPTLGDYNRTGVLQTKRTEGHNTPLLLTDDKYETTGNWKTTYPDSSSLTATIDQPLKADWSCEYKGSIAGTVNFIYQGLTGVIDFGDGTCDALWTIQKLDGTTININRE